MSAHTPAPWEWSGRWLYGKGKMILWYTTDDDGVHAKPEDARLIAASPDLLEALQSTAKYLDDLINEVVGSHEGRTGAQLRVVRAAIRKATGEQP